jgi:hypothetical protein
MQFGSSITLTGLRKSTRGCRYSTEEWHCKLNESAATPKPVPENGWDGQGVGVGFSLRVNLNDESSDRMVNVSDWGIYQKLELTF